MTRFNPYPSTGHAYINQALEEIDITHSAFESLDGDYLIAYKSCRSDGYSKFNFQFKYVLNKEYECHADYNVDNGNSFGLSAVEKPILNLSLPLALNSNPP